MPIYAYKCESCGFAKDVLQKMSDAPLTDCPSCAKPAFQKQVTAAGFQLKGSGWYATDFKGSGAAPSTAVAPAASGEAAPAAASSETPATSKAETAAPTAPAATPAAKPAPAAG
ncbi:FmdB family transcriptional regulator [Rhodoferax lacus]|uniref:FmdB family transcriptional regulator n=1 Tax=Rhodoferax lacus TaxID=2184758 RepID=A0A3E1RFA4_9BURK|nr:FmdB family zinc ribbon protein [Rhodoferax lacus]RFO98049.1 FmdB family transcriptional regulator [Rhodoferax lacus]